VGAPLRITSRQDLVDHARAAEGDGYALATVPDHASVALAPLIAATVLAEATSRLRVGTFLLANDLRHPAMLAKELATLDLLSGGRVEAGIGAGWMASDYQAIGTPMARPGVRIARLAEAIDICRMAWSAGRIDHAGAHYTVEQASCSPLPAQAGGPPIIVAGGMRQILTLAAEKADTVSISPGSIGGSGQESADDAALLAERVGWIREASVTRTEVPELHVLLSGVAVVDDRTAGPARCQELMGSALRQIGLDPPSVDPARVLTSPFYAVGSVDSICDSLRELRETHGISCFSVMEPFRREFAPVVDRLAGE
jgi:probable F420-dependent oxidoreductase